MQIYRENCKQHTGNTLPKKLIPISKNVIKEKSKCAICLTERFVIHEIEDKYDLESKLKVCPKFTTDRCYKTKWRLVA